MQKNMIKKMMLIGLVGCSVAVMRPAAGPNIGMNAAEFYILSPELQAIIINSLVDQAGDEQGALTLAVEGDLEWAIQPLMERIDRKQAEGLAFDADADEDLVHAMEASQINVQPAANQPVVHPVPAANAEPEDDLELALQLSHEQVAPVGNENDLDRVLRTSREAADKKDLEEAVNESENDYERQYAARELRDRRKRTVQSVCDRLLREKQDAEYQAGLAEDKRNAELRTTEQAGRAPVQAPVQVPVIGNVAPVARADQQGGAAAVPAAVAGQEPELTPQQRREMMARAHEARQNGQNKNGQNK